MVQLEVTFGKYHQFVRPESSATRETAFDVEGVPHKLNLLHNIFENGTTRMYGDQPGCFDEFGPFIVLANGINSKGAKYVKTGYVKAYLNTNTYYYLNKDGSFYVNNPDGSEFLRRDDGLELYRHDAAATAPEPAHWQEEITGQEFEDMVKIEVKEEEDVFIL